MQKIKIFTLVCFCLVLSNCSFNFETVEGMPDFDSAKAFSDRVVSLVIAEKNGELYSEMDSFFRKSYPPEVIPTTLEKVFGHFGKPIETEYRAEELVNWQYPDGTKKLARKFWYKVKTTNAEMGKYFLQVTVVKNGQKVACLSFSMLEFPDGIPENLR